MAEQILRNLPKDSTLAAVPPLSTLFFSSKIINLSSTIFIRSNFNLLILSLMTGLQVFLSSYTEVFLTFVEAIDLRKIASRIFDNLTFVEYEFPRESISFSSSAPRPPLDAQI